MEEQTNGLKRFMKAAHRHHYAREAIVSFEGDTRVETYPCACGAHKVVRTRTRPTQHGVCPDCGGRVRYDATRPKTYVGTDVYHEEGVFGVWYCKRCCRSEDGNFSIDYTPVPSVETTFYEEA